MFWTGVIILFFLITTQALFLLSKFRLRFELGVPICIMLDMFVLLFCGLLFSNLLIGVYGIFGLTLCGLLYVFSNEKKRFRKFLTVFRSPGFIVFTIGYAFCWLVSLPQVPHAWDDYGHWFPFVKQMLNYDMLYSDPNVYLMKQWYYTPAISLIQYMFCKLVGRFSVVACYAASTIVIFSSVLPVMKWFESRRKRNNIFAMLILFLSAYIVAGEDLDGFFLGFRSSYVDVHLAVVCTLLLCWILFEEESMSKQVYISIISAFLTMVKVTGIMFALLGTGTYILIIIVEAIVHSRGRKNGPHLKDDNACNRIIQGLVCILPFIATVIIYLMWSRHTTSDIEYGSILRTNFNGFTQSLHKFGQGLILRKFALTANWLRTYFFHFFVTKINGRALVQVTACPILVIFCCILFLKIRINIKKQMPIIRLTVMGICVIAGFFVYLLAIGISFYSFTENLETMTSYKRYLSSYAGIVVMLLFILGLRIFMFDLDLNKREHTFVLFTAMALLVLIMPKDFVTAVTGTAENQKYKSYYYNMSVWGQNIRSYMQYEQTANSKIFLVKNGHGSPDTPSLPADVAMPAYFIMPIEVQDFGQFRYDPNSDLPFYTKKEWNDLIIDYDFTNVLLANYSIPALGWQKPNMDRLSRMHPLFDCPPEELDYDAPLLFEVKVNDGNEVQLERVVVENPIQ